MCLRCCLCDNIPNNRDIFDMTENEGKKQVMRIVSSFSNASVIIATAGSQVSTTAEPVSRPYLDIQLQKTKDAAEVSLR